MSNLEQELLAAGFTPVRIPGKGALAFTGWIAPGTVPDRYDGYCTVCGCNAAECGGPTDVGDLNPDTDACGCWDDEAGEPAC